MGPWLRSHGRGRCRRAIAWSHSASMGPWLRSHGRSTSSTCAAGELLCFNGAVASQPRKGQRRQRPRQR